MKVLGIAVLLSLSSAYSAFGSDAVNWSGFYAGVYAGYGAGSAGNTWYNDEDSQWVEDGDIGYAGPKGGLFAGYQVENDGVLIGVEADVGLSNLIGDDASVEGRVNQIQISSLASLRGRVGITFDRLAVFGTAGIAAAGFTKSDEGPEDGYSQGTPQLGAGWVVGGGVEYAVDDNWHVRAEYLHIGLKDVETFLAYRHTSHAPTVNLVRVGASHQF